jgi:hypothetical protein
MHGPVEIFEFVQGDPGKPMRVDREAGVIRGVKVLGPKSANTSGNEYPRETREALAKEINAAGGARAYVDHPQHGASNETRSYRDSLGIHRNLRETGSGLVSDFYYNKAHPLAEQLVYDAEHMPELCGFSINTRCGRDRMEGGRRIIESIQWDRLRHGIDAVARGATCSTLYESLRNRPMRTIQEILRSPTAPKGFKKKLREQAESGILSPGDEVGEPTSDDAPAHVSALMSGYRQALSTLLDDDTLDLAGKIDRAKKILKAADELGPSGGDGGDDDEGEEQPGGMGPRGKMDSCGVVGGKPSFKESLAARHGDRLTLAEHFGGGRRGRTIQESARGSAAATTEDPVAARLRFLRHGDRRGA